MIRAPVAVHLCRSLTHEHSHRRRPAGRTLAANVRVIRAEIDNATMVPFSQGIHNSLLDPGPSLATTIELQSEIADFLASGGDSIVITNGTVIQP